MQSRVTFWLMQILTRLFYFVKDDTRRNPTKNVKQLVNTIELMEREKLVLPLLQVSGSDKGVNLLTVHGSKGLEYQYVFFVGANASVWEKKRNQRRGYKFPDNIFTSHSPEDSSGVVEELRRLFYVALTRAEHHIFISYCCFKNDKELEPSMFIAEILDQHDLGIERPLITEEEMVQFQSLHFEEIISPEIARIEEDLIGGLLERFVMNVTALNNYLKCPLEFYYRNLIRIPS